MFEASGWVGRTVVGEHRLFALAREDEALAIYAATSVVDGGGYTVAIAKDVVPQTGSMALEEAVSRAARHAVGVGALLPLLHGRSEGEGEGARLVVVRRAAVFPPISSLFLDGPREVGEVARMLAPVADALARLHDQGLAHGAISSGLLVVRDGVVSLDLFGISAVAEAAGGARAARDVVPPAYRPPELRGDGPTAPGPWSDTYALALVAVALLAGRDEIAFTVGDGELPTARTLGIDVPDRVEDVLRLALAVSPSPRPAMRTFLRELTRHADPLPVAPPSRASGQAVPAPLEGGASRPGALPIALAPARRDRASVWLAIAIGGVLAVFGLAMASAIVLLLREPGASPLATATATATATASPPPAATTTAPAVASPPITPPRTRGAATYPADAVALVPIESDAAVRGDRDALVSLVVFGDFVDPFTAKTLAELPLLEARYGGDLRIVFKLFPLAGSDAARAAAEAGAIVLARAGADAFFRFADLATKSASLDAGRLEELGIKAGLPAGATTEGLAHHAGAKLVDRDVDLGRRLGLRGTPVLMINGRRLDGYQPVEKLFPFLDFELTRARATKSVPRERLYAARVVTNVTTSEGELRPDGMPRTPTGP